MFGRRDKPGNDEKAFANGWAAGVRGMNGTYLKKPPPKPKTAPLKAWRVTFGDGYTEIVKADGYELRKRHAAFFRLKQHPRLRLCTHPDRQPWLEWGAFDYSETVVAEYFGVSRIEMIK